MIKKFKKWLKWESRTPHERKEFLIRVVLTVLFLLTGVIVGIVSLYLNGWDIVKFVQNPTTDFIIIICFIAVIILIVYRRNKEDV